MKAKRVLRYTGLAFSILVAIWVIIAAAIYFLVDVDDVKNIAKKAVAENTKGELEIGDVRLKVFPLVYFEIDGLEFKASEKFKRETIFGCKQAKLSFNLFSLIFGKPSITLKLNGPALNITSDGQTNSLSDVILPKKESSNVDVSKYLFLSRIKFKIHDANLKYKAPSKLYESKGLDMDLELDPVMRNLKLYSVIPVNAKDEAIKAKGKMSVSLDTHLSLDQSVKIEFTFDATELELKTASFEKPKGVDMSFFAKIETDSKKNSLDIKESYMNLAGKLLQAKGKIDNYKAEKPQIDADITIKPSSLEKLIPLFVAFKNAKVSGGLEAKAKIKGGADGSDVAFSLDATDVELKDPSFEKPRGVPIRLSFIGTTDLKSVNIRDLNLVVVQELLNLKGSIWGFKDKNIAFKINAVTPKYDIRNFYKLSPALAKKGLKGFFNLKANASGSTSNPVMDINFKYEDGKNNLGVLVFNSAKNADNITAKIASSFIDLNNYLPQEKKTAGKNKASEIKKSPKEIAAARKEPVVKKESLESIKKLIGNKNVIFSAKLEKVIFKELKLDNFAVDAGINKEALNVSKIHMTVIKSDVSAALKVLFNLKNPSYSGSVSVKDLKATEAVGTFFPSLKGVVDGVLTTDMAISCSGFSVDDMTKSLNGKGSFSFKNFRYSAQDLNKLVQEKVGDNLSKIGVSANKLTIKANPGWEVVEGIFTIASEKINISKLYGKDKAYEVFGKGFLTFDERVDMYLDFVVPYKNIPYEALKLEGKESSMLPLHLDGPAAKPRMDGPYTIKYLAEKAFQYEKKKLEAAAKKEAEKLKQKAKVEIQKAAEPVKAKLKEAIKGFKF